MKFNFGDYKGNYAMHCKTEEEARDFCRVMHEDGRKWNSGRSYLETNLWNNRGSALCYKFNSNLWDFVGSCRGDGYIILEWSDFMQKEFTKADLKDGMVGIDRDGSKYVYLNGVFMEDGGRHFLCENHDIMDDLTVRGFLSENLDIVRVCKSKGKTLSEYFYGGNLETIWERPEPIETTIAEIEAKLGVTGLKIIEE